MVAFSFLCTKDIISISTGQNIGRADDVELNENTASVENLIVYGRPKFFGLLGRAKDTRIPWADIITVGSDVILINTDRYKENDTSVKINVDYD